MARQEDHLPFSLSTEMTNEDILPKNRYTWYRRIITDKPDTKLRMLSTRRRGDGGMQRREPIDFPCGEACLCNVDIGSKGTITNGNGERVIIPQRVIIPCTSIWV